MPFKLIITLLISLLFTFSSIAKANEDLADNFSLMDIQTNNVVQLSHYQGKVIYLDFWASWCSSCAKALPLFSRWQNNFGEDFVVISINVDEDKLNGILMAKKLALTYPVAYDGDLKVASLYNVKALPTSFIINKRGRIVYRHLGFKQQDVDKLVEIIHSLL